MLKVLIVDDEPIIRDGLKIFIDWQKYGYEVCGEAANGKDGVLKTEELEPDLVIVDIKMPVMDGLRMIEALRNKDINIKFIVLTGYSEFQYAKKALEYGVSSYILKPIDEDEFIVEINKISKEIEVNEKNNSLLNKCLPLLRAQTLENLFSQKIDIDNAKKEFDWLHLPWSSYQVILIDIDKANSMKSNVKFEVKEIIENFIKDNQYGYVFSTNNRIGILLKDVYFCSFKRSIEILQKCIQKKLSASTFIAIGRETKKFDDIWYSYEDACNLLNTGFILSNEKIVDIKEYKGLTVQDVKFNLKNLYESDIIEKLYMSIDANNRENLYCILSEIFKKIKISCNTEYNIKASLAYIYVNIIHELSLKNSDFKSNEYINEEVFKEIYKKNSIDDLHEYIKLRFSDILDCLANNRPDSTIKKVIDYVDRNYNKDIKLEILADIFGYNSAYLGKQFKKYTREYFNTYIDKLRIQHAEQLLKEGFKIGKAAEMVGYKDNDYFTLKFKKYIGISPSEYKKSGAIIKNN